MPAKVMDARKSDKGRVELQVSVPPTDVAFVMDECEEQLARTGGIIPGTRDDLVARYGEERLGKLIDEWLMERFGTEVLGSSENPLIGFSQFYLVENGYPEGPLVFQIVAYELPKGTLSSNRPLIIGHEACRPSDESIDSAIQSLMRAYSAQRTSDEQRPAKLGDTVKADIEISAGGVPIVSLSKRATSLKLDYATMPQSFIDQVVGMSPGDVKEFTYTVPAIEGACDEELLDAKVTLKALYFVDEPKPTAAWIQGKFPGLKTLDDLRFAMAQNIAQRAGGLPSKEDAIDNALFARLDVEIPDEMVDFAFEGVKRAEGQRIHAQGIGLDSYCLANGTTPEEHYAKLRKTVERDLKLSVALDAMYAARDMTLVESDLDALFEQMVPGRGAEMKHGYTMSGRLYLAEEMAQRAKVRRWLHETAELAERES